MLDFSSTITARSMTIQIRGSQAKNSLKALPSFDLVLLIDIEPPPHLD